LGLDRTPEVKTYRKKIFHLAHEGKIQEWSAILCQEWMSENPEHASSLYIDGHVRVYHGNKANLPKHYVARQKLCLKAACDYSINAMNGQPFFLINKDVDPGLLQVLEHEIVPRALKEVPNQPSEEALKQDLLLHRFALVFDRKGYSPEFMSRMKNSRIGCLTYHKFPGKDWDKEEFLLQKVKLVSGEIIEMELAERGTFLKHLWVRETRRLSKNGHQTSIISTVYRMELGTLTIDGEIEPEKVEKYEKAKATLQEEITIAKEEIANLKIERKNTPKHILTSELPELERFQRLNTKSKDFLDTIKMICYRAETAMANILKDAMTRVDDARSFAKSLYQLEADLLPDKEKGILKVRLHRLATRSADETLEGLCSILNETETIFPGTNLRLFYEMVSC